MEITAGDFLAGGGGVTEAMTKIPGVKVKWVLNHDPIAIRTELLIYNYPVNNTLFNNQNF